MRVSVGCRGWCTIRVAPLDAGRAKGRACLIERVRRRTGPPGRGQEQQCQTLELDGLLSKGNRKSVDRIFYVGATRAAHGHRHSLLRRL